jgi:hypothetical protein
MTRISLALASLAIAMVCLAAPAQGQAPSGDSVTGTIEEQFLPTLLITWTFDASSGPQGENPTGTVFNQFLGTGPVTCLSVEGNRAVIGTFFASVGSSWLIYVVDGGIFDTIEYESFDSPPITVCPPAGSGPEGRVVNGNLTVVDAQPPPLPTAKEDCKNGGWRNYPQFKNEGQCIKLVQHTPNP